MKSIIKSREYEGSTHSIALTGGVFFFDQRNRLLSCTGNIFLFFLETWNSFFLVIFESRVDSLSNVKSEILKIVKRSLTWYLGKFDASILMKDIKKTK